MQKISVNIPIRIDLSDKEPDEIAEYLQALLVVQYEAQKKGLKLEINKQTSPQIFKITPA
jgi:hypothetical protein